MAKITVTFQEEGKDPVSFIIPENVSTTLDQFVAETTDYTSDGPVQRYTDKADLFLKHNIDTLLSPIIDRYPDPDVAAKKEQIATLQAEIAAIQTAAIVPVQGTSTE